MRKIVILTEGHTHPLTAKTARSVIRYRGEEVIAVLDSTEAGKTSGQLLQVGGDLPIVASLAEAAGADTLLLGIATQGGRIPAAWRPTLLEAIDRGMDVISGLHDFLSDDPEITAAARQRGVEIVDVRKNRHRSVANRRGIRPDCLRVHTVGNDCNVGKMITSFEITRAVRERQLDAKFIATGQTGIMIEGDGCPIDCVVADFVNGAAEQLVLDHQHHDVLVIEGQGCIVHPRYSAVTVGLLHGALPQALILCYEAGRTTFGTMDYVAIPALETIRDLCESMASAARPCRVIGISMNSRNLTAEQAEAERADIRDRFGLPVCDVVRHGPDELADAVVRFYHQDGWKDAVGTLP
jgi:uncharacterized NAD-dependent epimerase/dehydratase family protein